MTYCKHGTFVGDPFGPDHICGACEDGLCVHGRKVSAFAWEDAEGCESCGVEARQRTVASLEEAQRIASFVQIVTANLNQRDDWMVAQLTRRGMSEIEATAFVADCLKNKTHVTPEWREAAYRSTHR